jgi:hypothetical protein
MRSTSDVGCFGLDGEAANATTKLMKTMVALEASMKNTTSLDERMTTVHKKNLHKLELLGLKKN